MTVDARVGTYVFTHSEVADIDQAQYDTGDGPCVDAFRQGEAIVIGSTLESGPYPVFRAVAADHGMLSVASLPMNATEVTVGALNLYATRSHAFDDEAVRTGRTFADDAAYLLLNHQAYWDVHSLSENLQQALVSRATIEQAKGIIMATTGCTPDEAFDRLREQSQQENVKLRDLAEILVRQSHRPE
jgi:GAF domain-containing protein